MKNKIVKVDALARVEGEGGIYIKTKGDEVTEVKVNIYEPPRFFEAFLRGRNYKEVPDIVARICGICPMAYQISAVNAFEKAFGITIDTQVRNLRRLMYCGEWIESHVLHVYMLHAPDFLGYEDAIRLAKDHPEVVTKALRLKKIGNDLMTFLGGREIHPISIKVGGFYKVPTKKDLRKMKDELEWARDTSIEMVKFTSTLNFPDFNQDYTFVSLNHPDEYPITEGDLITSKGLKIPLEQYEEHFEEIHVEHSNALHSNYKGEGPYFVGPMARYNLQFDKLSSIAKEVAKDCKLPFPITNPFMSIFVRSVETLYAVDEALRLIDNYEMPDSPSVEFQPRDGIGYGCTEAPRGICYHRYRSDKNGNVVHSKIVPPTAQNFKRMELDLLNFVKPRISMNEKDLTWQCEQAIRNYDPCISCATHFLKLKIERE
jgi:sulfhydrogenase subunit alpha